MSGATTYATLTHHPNLLVAFALVRHQRPQHSYDLEPEEEIELTIDTADLRRVFEVLVQHLEDTDQASAEIPWDFYWDMTTEDRYNPYSEPKELNLGQLSDDWNDLLRISGGEMPPVGYALTWLSSILRSMGELSRR